jgi:4-amino-4-deoxy-L-arabinose transferase-like glycosyltransferase
MTNRTDYPSRNWIWFSAFLWLVLMVVALFWRPLLPVDETRYAAVAWEMWLRGDWLVPYLNGEPYHHKPPLLFWLMKFGWALFGVNDITPRLVAPFFGLANLFLTAAIARRLWPDRPDIAVWAPLVLIGSLFWTLFTTLTMFDMMVGFFALLGLYGVLEAWKTGRRAGWWWFGIAVGFGILAKGPAILLHVVPVAILAPLWTVAGRPHGWARWYGGIGFGFLVGVVIALCWAVPAGIAGGEEYRNMIFWGQTAGRMVEAFDHARPWYWYAVLMPALLIPWTIWPAFWRNIRGMRRSGTESGIRFTAIWIGFAFVTFSLISGKQLHYLLPEFPAFALVVARALSGLRKAPSSRIDHFPAALMLVLGVAVVIAPFVSQRVPDWVVSLPSGWGFLLAGLAGWLIMKPRQTMTGTIAGLASLTTMLVIVVHLVAEPRLTSDYDVRAVAQELKRQEDAGHPLSYYGKYHGQFNFAGRLTKPIVTTGDMEAANWILHNPEGRFITLHRILPETDLKPEYLGFYRGRYLAIWPAEIVADNPDVVKRAPGDQSPNFPSDWRARNEKRKAGQN